MRLLRNHPYQPIFLLGFFALAARIGVLASTWILFMARFNVTPVLSALMCVFGQGFITVMKPLSQQILSRYSLLVSQRSGAVIGIVSCIALIWIHNLALFLVLVLVASFSKVAIESTFPRVTHAFLVDDEKFSPRFIGIQQAAILFVSAIIAPVAFAGYVALPVVISAVLYGAVLVVTYLYPQCGDDGYVEVLDTHSTQEQFNRRFSDIRRNECIREHQSRIHRFRRIPSTLLSIDLFVCIIAGAAATLMPLCFREISHVGQGMDSLLCCIFGVFAAITGLVILPWVQRRVALTENQEFRSLVVLLALCLVSCIFYTTFAGVKVGIMCAVINGIAITANRSILHRIASRNLIQNEYQKFGCLLMQREALARVGTPIFIGVLASMTSLHFTVTVLVILAAVFVVVTGARVSLIVHGRRYDYRTLQSVENPLHSARKLRTGRRTGKDLITVNQELAHEFLQRRYLRSRTESSSHNRISIRRRSRWIAFAFPQEDKTVASTGRSPRPG